MSIFAMFRCVSSFNSDGIETVQMVPEPYEVDAKKPKKGDPIPLWDGQPSGSLTFYVTNPDAQGQFAAGAFYKVELTKE